jgi:hypothetical protein
MRLLHVEVRVGGTRPLEMWPQTANADETDSRRVGSFG